VLYSAFEDLCYELRPSYGCGAVVLKLHEFGLPSQLRTDDDHAKSKNEAIAASALFAINQLKMFR